MKLIGPQTSQVQSLGRHQSGLTAEAGKAEAIGIVTEGVSNALGSLAGASEDILETNTRRQQQQGDLRNQKVETEFWEPIGGKEFFDVSEIEATHPDLVTDSMRVKGRVLAAEIVPQMYQEFMSEQIKQSSLIIENDNMRNEWLARTNETFLGRQQQIQSQANSTIERQIFIDQKINFNNAMDMDRPDVALRITQEMKGNPKIVEPLQDEARKGTETVRYKEYILNENSDGLVRSVNFLKQESDSYQEQNGQLNDDERMAWKGKLQNSINQIKAKANAGTAAEKRMLEREIRITSQNALNGNKSDTESDLDLLSRVDNFNAKTGNGDPSVGDLNASRADLVNKIAFDNVNDTMLLKSRSERESFIKNSQIPRGFEGDEFRGRLQKSHEAQTQLENTDFMQAVSNATGSLSTIDFNSSPQEMADQFNYRYQQYLNAQGMYGDGLGEGIFTKNEAESFSSMINSKTPREKAELILSIGAVFGQDSSNIYEQLGTDGSAKSFSVAGTLSAKGNQSAAEAIIDGNAYRLDPQQNLGDLKSAIRPKLFESIGNAYGASNYGASIQEAILDHYISNARWTTDLTDVETGGWFSEDLYQKSVDSVTGGILEYNGQKVVAMNPGMSQGMFDNWIENISPDYIQQLGGSHIHTGLEVSDMLRNSEVTIRPVGEKSFTIVDNRGATLRTNEIGNPPLVLRYDETVKTRPPANIERQKPRSNARSAR